MGFVVDWMYGFALLQVVRSCLLCFFNSQHRLSQGWKTFFFSLKNLIYNAFSLYTFQFYATVFSYKNVLFNSGKWFLCSVILDVCQVMGKWKCIFQAGKIIQLLLLSQLKAKVFSQLVTKSWIKKDISEGCIPLHLSCTAKTKCA